MSNELARINTRSDTRPGVAELVEVASQAKEIKDLGTTLIASGLLPDAIKKPESAVAVMIKGAEVGLGAMYALSHIAIISGKPAMSAEAMTALVQRAGHAIRIVETSSEKCVVEGVRPSSGATTPKPCACTSRALRRGPNHRRGFIPQSPRSLPSR